MRRFDPRIDQGTARLDLMDCRIGDRPGERQPGNDDCGCVKPIGKRRQR